MLNIAQLTGPQDVSNLLAQLNTLIVALNSQSVGLVNQLAATVGNGADATDDVLASFVIPPSFFNFAGSLKLHAAGALAANANAKSVKVKINDTVTTVTMVGLNAVAANNRNWYMDVTVSRRAVSSQAFDFRYSDGTSFGSGNGTATEVETNPWTITVTGTSAASAANDVTALVATLETAR